jgi:2-polyprenyl-3-methyl-5-hydroxy-6-metoxy-1,4-benzoquinol methylase
MNILSKLFKTKKIDNIAWKSDKPTPYLVGCFNDGLIKKGDFVVDIGCGFGRNSNWLAIKNIDVTAINIDKQEITYAKSRAKVLDAHVRYILADFLKFNNKGKLFDVALDLGCSHMLSATDQYLFEEKVATILKTNGILVYFGFSKNHPAYDLANEQAMYRSWEDIRKIYGEDFEILSQEEHNWSPSPEENSKFLEHIGLKIIMRRK